MSGRILAIDPGAKASTWLHYDSNPPEVLSFALTEPNSAVLRTLAEWSPVAGTPLVLETMCCMGQRVGRDTFQTAIWIGRFEQVWHGRGGVFHEVERPDIKRKLCHDRRGTPTMVRHALSHYFGHDTPREAKGTVKKPGPLFGVKEHIWSALAVAVFFAETGGHGE